MDYVLLKWCVYSVPTYLSNIVLYLMISIEATQEYFRGDVKTDLHCIRTSERIHYNEVYTYYISRFRIPFRTVRRR